MNKTKFKEFLNAKAQRKIITLNRLFCLRIEEDENEEKMFLVFSPANVAVELICREYDALVNEIANEMENIMYDFSKNLVAETKKELLE